MSAAPEVIMDMDTDHNDFTSAREEEMEESIENLSEKEKLELAEEKKNEGNTLYKNKQYKEALQLYSSAIDLCPHIVAYYGNRAATYIMLGGYKNALEDANRAVSLDENFLKGYLRAAKCHLAMGDPRAAIHGYERVLSMEKSNATAKAELVQARAIQTFEHEAEKCIEKGDFRKALYCIERCIDQCMACTKFKTTKAELLALLGRFQESQEIANDILRSDSLNAEAIYVRGMCLYYQDNVEKAFQHFQQVLRLAPDHTKTKKIYKKAKALGAKKAEGNAAFKTGKFQDAFKIYSEALEIDPNNKFTNSKLYHNRAMVCSKIGKLEQGVEDCTKAIELDDTYLKAYMRRAKCYMDLEQFEEAVRDYEKVYNMDKTRENKHALQEAKLELKKSKRKDYYKILGVSKDGNEDEIKKAYKKRALVHHPDRHSHASPEVQKEEEKKFKEIGEAYSILSDPKKKARYDSGQDLEDLEGGHGFSDIDPNLIFQAFFGGGGGGGFGGYGGHHGHSHGGGAHGFPGGFSFQFG